MLVHPMRLMRRDLFDFADPKLALSAQRARLRVRDEGDKLTVTFKKALPGSIYSDEIETTVGSYSVMKDLLKAIGLDVKTHQESKRETWHLDDVEVVIDVWPWINPYIEIEGKSEDAIQAAAAKLGFDWTKATFGSVEAAYRAEYPKMTDDEEIGAIPEVIFGAELPEYLIKRQ